MTFFFVVGKDLSSVFYKPLFDKANIMVIDVPKIGEILYVGEFATGRKSEKWKDCSDSGTFYYNASELLIKQLYFLYFFEENNTSMALK